MFLLVTEGCALMWYNPILSTVCWFLCVEYDFIVLFLCEQLFELMKEKGMDFDQDWMLLNVSKVILSNELFFSQLSLWTF